MSDTSDVERLLLLAAHEIDDALLQDALLQQAVAHAFAHYVVPMAVLTGPSYEIVVAVRKPVDPAEDLR